MLDMLLKEKNLTIYQCAKLSGIPYTTLSEVVRGKTRIEKCSAETIYLLSNVLNVTMEDLIRDSLGKRADFEIFKSNICHRVKDIGALDYIVSELKADNITKHWNRKWYPEAFYLLAMVDYLSRINDIPLCTRYDDMRKKALPEPIYPKDITLTAKLHPDLDLKERCLSEAIPEFLRFNIIESEIENVY